MFLKTYPSKQIVELHCLVRRHSILILTALRSDPKVDVPFKSGLHLVGVHNDVRVPTIELPVRLLGDTLDPKIRVVVRISCVLYSPYFETRGLDKYRAIQ